MVPVLAAFTSQQYKEPYHPPFPGSGMALLPPGYPPRLQIERYFLCMFCQFQERKLSFDIAYEVGYPLCQVQHILFRDFPHVSVLVFSVSMHDVVPYGYILHQYADVPQVNIQDGLVYRLHPIQIVVYYFPQAFPDMQVDFVHHGEKVGQRDFLILEILEFFRKLPFIFCVRQYLLYKPVAQICLHAADYVGKKGPVQ